MGQKLTDPRGPSVLIISASVQWNCLESARTKQKSANQGDRLL